MNPEQLLKDIELSNEKLNINPLDIDNIERITTGKRNNCYCIKTVDKNVFCKSFNKELRYASQFDKSRYYVEINSLEFLNRNNCAVPQVIYSDEKNEIMLLEYINGKTLKQKIRENLDKEPVLIRKTLDEISKIHKLDVKNDDFPNIVFKKLEKNDYYKSMKKTLYKLYEFIGQKDRKISEEDNIVLENVAETLAKQKLKYGHFELHNENIMCNNNDDIFFVDFEKFHPHVPQLDLISLIMNENINKNNIVKYIEYYIEINDISNREEFLYVLDCANLFYNLKIINMIIRNTLGYETKWENVNGQIVKKVEKTNTNFGTKWNSERNESIEMRVSNIVDFNFSKNCDIKRAKRSLFEEVL